MSRFLRKTLSQILPHHVPNGFRCLDLHGVGGVGVGAQSEARVGVSQHAGDGADIHAALQGRGCEGVPQIVEANGFQPQCFQNLFVNGVHRILMLEEIEKETSSSAASSTQENPEPDNHPSVSVMRVKVLLDLVKGEDVKYIPQRDTNESVNRINKFSRTGQRRKIYRRGDMGASGNLPIFDSSQPSMRLLRINFFYLLHEAFSLFCGAIPAQGQQPLSKPRNTGKNRHSNPLFQN